MTLTLPHTTKEYVPLSVTDIAGLTTAQLEALDVEAALIAGGSSHDEPEEADWHDASWQTLSGTSYALLLVGTGSDFGALAEGTVYGAWVRIGSTPELIVRFCGYVKAT
jgi:hypothetical protein